MGEESTERETPAYRDPEPFAVAAQGQSLTFYPGGEDRLAALLEMVGSARRTLDLCFYIFAEDRVATALRDALCDAVRRGVRVTLIVDSFGASASARFLAPLTECGGMTYSFSPRWGARYLDPQPSEDGDRRRRTRAVRRVQYRGRLFRPAGCGRLDRSRDRHRGRCGRRVGRMVRRAARLGGCPAHRFPRDPPGGARLGMDARPRAMRAGWWAGRRADCRAGHAASPAISSRATGSTC